MVRPYQLQGILPLPKSKTFTKSEKKINILIKWDNLHYSSNWFTAYHKGWQLPGTEEPKPSCGMWRTKGCLRFENHPDNMAWVKHYKTSCFKAGCKKCASSWIDREASRSTKRIETLLENATSFFGKGFRCNPIHIVISVPKKDWNLDFPILKKLARKVLKEVECQGGLMIFHPFRQVKETNVNSLGYFGLKVGDWYYSPHFHVIGVGYISGRAIEDTYDETEWIIKNLGVRRSVYQTAWYQLSHAGINKKFHSVTWFGVLGYRSAFFTYSKVTLEKEESLDDFCPYCFVKLESLNQNGEDRGPPIFPVEGLDPADGWEYQDPHLEGHRKRGEDVCLCSSEVRGGEGR